MALRTHGFDGLDPLKVPLPNGTEVVTRVARQHRDGEVPQGALGRVTAAEGNEVTVRVVGVGAVQYHREEVVPRRKGQLRFARRRYVAWQALHRCIVLEATVGSRAWGLADEESDIDQRGIFCWPFSWTTALTDPPEDLHSRDGSAGYWEVEKAIKQALRADPNTLELLFVEGVEARDPIGEWILAEREAFVSAEIYGSFGRYALSQLKKLQHSLRLARHRDAVLGWLQTDPGLSLDAVAERLAQVGEIPAPAGHAAYRRARQYVKDLYRSLYGQGYLEGRSFEALVRFAGEGEAGLELPRTLRPKNAYNLLRLLWTAVEWLETGEVAFRMEGARRARLLAIKGGEVPLDEILAEADTWLPRLEAARRSTRLPQRADLSRADELFRRIRTELARRWLSQEPGPFGLDAAELEPAAWADEEHQDEGTDPCGND